MVKDPLPFDVRNIVSSDHDVPVDYIAKLCKKNDPTTWNVIKCHRKTGWKFTRLAFNARRNAVECEKSHKIDANFSVNLHLHFTVIIMMVNVFILYVQCCFPIHWLNFSPEKQVLHHPDAVNICNSTLFLLKRIIYWPQPVYNISRAKSRWFSDVDGRCYTLKNLEIQYCKSHQPTNDTRSRSMFHHHHHMIFAC
jgi:hypothetical protein